MKKEREDRLKAVFEAIDNELQFGGLGRALEAVNSDSPTHNSLLARVTGGRPGPGPLQQLSSIVGALWAGLCFMLRSPLAALAQLSLWRCAAVTQEHATLRAQKHCPSLHHRSPTLQSPRRSPALP